MNLNLFCTACGVSTSPPGNAVLRPLHGVRHSLPAWDLHYSQLSRAVHSGRRPAVVSCQEELLWCSAAIVIFANETSLTLKHHRAILAAACGPRPLPHRPSTMVGVSGVARSRLTDKNNNRREQEFGRRKECVSRIGTVLGAKFSSSSKQQYNSRVKCYQT